ncbi:Late secretory pathway protein AVL9 [Araneus ventricosus]|uniref:Late secretory pathway protein AVL9 n=1 Tax=Araneus ventricosus TaxID=182803 RepID=A0A4Y2DX73_ARAVE|nr:Late secretory pathway protein AVL9 [Araneus ventricosus]
MKFINSFKFTTRVMNPVADVAQKFGEELLAWVDDGKIEIIDPDLKKQLNLTTEDLRFADHIVRHVMEDRQDVFLDGTGWEGGDEWLRSQFKIYLLSLMRTSEIEGNGKELEPFNPSFVNAWKQTHNYKMWSCSMHSGILEVNPGHPFQGQLSMADMKLKFSHTMQSSERGRRLNTAVVNTGKAVVQTGKAVGGYTPYSLRSSTPKNHVVILLGSLRDPSSLRSLAVQLRLSASKRKL